MVKHYDPSGPKDGSGPDEELEPRPEDLELASEGNGAVPGVDFDDAEDGDDL